MKGIIFNLLEEVVSSRLGERAWDDMLRRTGVEGVYTSLGNYASAQFVSLVGALAAITGDTRQETLRWFGRYAMVPLIRRYPDFFTVHPNLRSFLLSLNEVVHAEVRKLYPGANVPVFDFRTPDAPDNSATAPLDIRYRSSRQMCHLAEGFIGGAADHYREHAIIEQSRCMLKGDEECILQCTFGQAQ